MRHIRSAVAPYWRHDFFIININLIRSRKEGSAHLSEGSAHQLKTFSTNKTRWYFGGHCNELE